MKRSLMFLAFGSMVSMGVAGAYEYPLQFTPNAGFRGLVVAGYQFAGNTVVGNCSYYTVSTSGGGGKGGGGHASGKKIYAQTCTWDLFGNLLGVTQGAPAAPPPLQVTEKLVVYAQNANGDTAGFDEAKGQGFVNTPGSHYTWLTPNSNAVVRQMLYTFTVHLKSDGDFPVDITQVTPSALLATVVLKSTDCTDKPLAPGSNCSVTVSYDASQVTSADDTVTDTFRIDLMSNAGEAHDFIQKFTVVTNR